MPQLPAGQAPTAHAPQLYGVDKPVNNLPFQEKLYQMFKPQEFVTIKNIDDEPIYWQYLPEDKETFSMSDDGMQKQIYRESPEMWYLGPGETDVLVGANAYRALDVMYKAVAAKSTLRKYRDPNSPLFDEKGQHLPKNFNFSDSSLQDSVIKQAYVGKATPVFDGFQNQSLPTASQVQTEPIVTATPAFADLPTTAAPMTAVPQDGLAQPKTSAGAPLVAPTYASPELESSAEITSDGKAKVVRSEPTSQR